MKKLRFIFETVGMFIIAAFIMTLPFTSQYMLYGSSRNGYIVYRYPHSTEVVIHTASNIITIVGKNDCTPDHKTICIPTPKFSLYETAPLTVADYQIWKKAMD